jgi:uncharacterized protein (DUF433 family)
MSQHPRISIDPDIMVGKPVIKGTRLPVEFIIELMIAEWTHQDIIDNYPGVVREDILACLAYARDTLISQWHRQKPGNRAAAGR